MKTPVFIFLCLLVSTPAQAAEWRELGVDNNGTVISIDLESITDGKDEAYRPFTSVWVRRDHSNDDSAPHSKSLALLLIRCGQREAAVKSALAYDQSGNMVDRQTRDYPKFQPIPPDSIYDTVHAVVCERNE